MFGENRQRIDSLEKTVDTMGRLMTQTESRLESLGERFNALCEHLNLEVQYNWGMEVKKKDKAKGQ